MEKWLSILAEHGKKIGVVTRMNQVSATSTLRTLGVDMDLVLTIEDEMTDDAAAELARKACLSKGVSPHQSAYVSASPHGGRVAELAGMRHFHPGWVCDADPGGNITSFETFDDAAIHFLESGR